MALGLWVFSAWLVFMVIITGALIYWGKSEGQFKNIEEPKYRMLEDHEPLPWPGREKKSSKTKGSGRGGEHG